MKILRQLFLGTFFTTVGYFAALLTNGHGTLLLAYDASSLNEGLQISKRILEIIKLPDGEYETNKIISDKYLKICIQSPYQTPSSTRLMLNANLVGGRSASEDEILIWFVDGTYISKYISIPRSYINKIKTSEKMNSCITPTSSKFLKISNLSKTEFFFRDLP